MSSRFNDVAQSRYSAIEGEALTVYQAKYRADFSYMDSHIQTQEWIMSPSLCFLGKIQSPQTKQSTSALESTSLKLTLLGLKYSTLLGQKVICRTETLDLQAELLVMTRERRALKVLRSQTKLSPVLKRTKVLSSHTMQAWLLKSTAQWMSARWLEFCLGCNMPCF